MGKTLFFDLIDLFRPRRFRAKTPDLFLGTRLEVRISGKYERRKNIEILWSKQIEIHSASPLFFAYHHTISE